MPRALGSYTGCILALAVVSGGGLVRPGFQILNVALLDSDAHGTAIIRLLCSEAFFVVPTLGSSLDSTHQTPFQLSRTGLANPPEAAIEPDPIQQTVRSADLLVRLPRLPPKRSQHTLGFRPQGRVTVANRQGDEHWRSVIR